MVSKTGKDLMLRFSLNRWWAFILALCLFTACLVVSTARGPTVANASSASPVLNPSDQQGPGGGSFGDPDVPVGPGQGLIGKTSVSRGGSKGAVSGAGARPAGDGTVPSSVVMQRLRIVLLSLRNRYLGF
jgi:hypothetical protein